MPGVQPILNDIVQFRVSSLEGNQLSLNVLHYRVSLVTGGGLTLAQLASAMSAHLSPLYRAWMPISAFFDEVSAQNVSPPMTIAFVTGTHSPGTALGNGMARQVSGLISYKTLLAGHAQRGRSYIGLGSSEFMDVGGILSGAGLGVIGNIATGIGPSIALTLGGAVTGLQLVIRHPDTIGPPKAVNTTDVLTVTAEAFLATQKRRGDFGRPNVQ